MPGNHCRRLPGRLGPWRDGRIRHFFPDIINNIFQSSAHRSDKQRRVTSACVRFYWWIPCGRCLPDQERQCCIVAVYCSILSRGRSVFAPRDAGARQNGCDLRWRNGIGSRSAYCKKLDDVREHSTLSNDAQHCRHCSKHSSLSQCTDHRDFRITALGSLVGLEPDWTCGNHSRGRSVCLCIDQGMAEALTRKTSRLCIVDYLCRPWRRSRNRRQNEISMGRTHIDPARNALHGLLAFAGRDWNAAVCHQ